MLLTLGAAALADDPPPGYESTSETVDVVGDAGSCEAFQRDAMTDWRNASIVGIPDGAPANSYCAFQINPRRIAVFYQRGSTHTTRTIFWHLFDVTDPSDASGNPGHDDDAKAVCHVPVDRGDSTSNLQIKDSHPSGMTSSSFCSSTGHLSGGNAWWFYDIPEDE